MRSPNYPPWHRALHKVCIVGIPLGANEGSADEVCDVSDSRNAAVLSVQSLQSVWKLQFVNIYLLKKPSDCLLLRVEGLGDM